MTTWVGDGVQTDDVDVDVEELVVLVNEVMVLLVDVAMLVGVSLLVTET